MLSFLALLGLAVMLFALLLRRESGMGPRLVFAAQDEDIRIASDNPSRDMRRPRDTGESVAADYTHHKENGNIFMANRLGEELAKPLLNSEPELFIGLDDANRRQLQFLYGFAVRVCVSQGIGNSILADTVLHSFWEIVQSRDAVIYDAINDNTADTIYRLCLRGEGSIGGAFAKLCSENPDAALEELGRSSFERFAAYVGGYAAKFAFKA